MRKRRYILLGVLVTSVYVALFWVAREQALARAEEHSAALKESLTSSLKRFGEHARHLAGMPPGYAVHHLASFHSLAGAEIFDASGREILHVERSGGGVVTLPADRLTDRAPDVSGISQTTPDVSAVEVTRNPSEGLPRRRVLLQYTARRPDGGSVVLMVYAEPILRRLKEAGAGFSCPGTGFLLPQPQPPFVIAATRRWTLYVPVSMADLSRGLIWSLAGIAAAVLAVGIVAVVLSERYFRAMERAEVQARLAQRDRLTSLGLLVAGVSHEINNPLEGIGNWLSVGNVEKAKEGLERIRAIVKDLLTFAAPKKQTGVSKVAECVARSLDLARHSKIFGRVEVSVDVAGDLAARISAPALEQVFLNVLLNAGKAMEKTEHPRMEIHAAKRDGVVTVDFRDFGPGVDKSDVANVFDPFFTRSEGTGLGLSVSHGIVRAAGGDMRAEAANPGARFVVEVPSA